MTAKIVKWGNGQGLRIPKSVMREMKISLGDNLEMTLENGKIIIEKMYSHRTLEERASVYGGKLGPYKEVIDWGESVGREAW